MHRGLSFQLALSVAALALIAAIASSAFFYLRTQALELEAGYAQLRDLGKTVHRTAEIAAYIDNEEIGQEVLTGLRAHSIVAGARLTSATGMAISAGDVGSESVTVEPILVSLKSPFDSAEQVGELMIAPHEEQIVSDARSVALAQATLLGVHTLLVALIVMWVIQLRFLRSINSLARNLHAVEPGGDVRVSCPSHHREDEIGGLTSDVNRLLDVVSVAMQRERDLRSHFESLERRFRMIYEQASVAIVLFDSDGSYFMANRAFGQLVGEARLQSLANATGRRIEALFEDEKMVRQMLADALAGRSMPAVDLRLTSAGDDETRWAHCFFSAVGDADEDGNEEGRFVEVILADVTDRRTRELQARFEAEHDGLTGLYNRRAADREIRSTLQRGAAEGARFAICVIDLDDFKPVNDLHGHDAGDAVLQAVAHRTNGCLRDDDFAARLGGDEFLAVLRDVESVDNAVLVAQKIADAVSQPITVPSGEELAVGASLGLALFPAHGDRLEDLFKRADEAMYLAKQRGKNTVVCYDAA